LFFTACGEKFRASDGWMAAGHRKMCRGKSGLHGNTVTDNIRRGKPQGKRHRNETAYRPKAAARLKRCGKSAPRLWQQRWHGKPHREQDQIGTARNPFPDSRPGRSREVCSNAHPRGMAIHRGQPRGQNPAYRPSDTYIFKARPILESGAHRSRCLAIVFDAGRDSSAYCNDGAE
jgi:hypothetical protein